MSSNGQPPRDESISPSVLKAAFSYLYVAVWVYTYWIRTITAPVFRWLLVPLIVVELIGPWSDLYSPKESWPLAWRIILAVTLFLVALTLSINHRRLDVRLQRHDVILSSIRVLMEEGTLDDKDASSTVKRIGQVLDALVFSIGYGRKHSVINATLMMRAHPDNQFRIAVQDSRSKFDLNISLDANRSVAAKVATEERPDIVIYVPNTKFLHGVRIDLLKAFPKRDYFRATEIVPGAFQWIDEANQAVVRSLVCIQVPVTTKNVGAVLCVSDQDTNTLGYLELSAMKVAAGLIVQVLRQPGAVPALIKQS